MCKQRICLHLMILLIAALSAGCSSPPTKTVRMYAGAELAKEDIALLQPMEQASIDFVDGKKLGGRDFAEVLPGEHKLMIKVSTRTYNGASWGWIVGYTDVSFMARAGHIYEVYAHKEGRAVQAWVVDTQTGVVVGGRKPNASRRVVSTRTYASVGDIKSLVDSAESAERGEHAMVPAGGWLNAFNNAATWLDKHTQENQDDVPAHILRARLGRLQDLLTPVVFSRGVDPPTMEQYAKEQAPLHAGLDRALALEPQNPEAYYWKARLLALRKPVMQDDTFVRVYIDLDKAISLAGEAVRLAPSNATYREALAILLFDNNQIDSAIATMRSVDNGRHLLFKLLTELKAIPIPDQAVFSAQHTEGFVQMVTESGRIHNYHQLRIRIYDINLTIEEIESFYQHTWPYFEFFEVDPESIGAPGKRVFGQVLQQHNGVLTPVRTMQEFLKVVDDDDTDTLGLMLHEIPRPDAEAPQTSDSDEDNAQWRLFILNYKYR